MDETDTVRFLLDGAVVVAPPLPATTTLLDYLREVAGRTGTKEGCAEGDCGACTVALGQFDGERIRYRAINSCIRLLPTVDGCEVVTVESLHRPDEPAHPVQQAMVDCHASQCGFCTPGFVMSLFAHYLEHTSTSREAVTDALSGNLCRCTGYRPIIEAGVASFAQPEPERWNRRDAQSSARIEAHRAITREQALKLPDFQAPRSLAALADAYAQAPDSLLLAGGTDIGLWVTQHLRDLPSILYLGEVAELQSIEVGDDGLAIGAAVTLTEAWGAIVARYPALSELARRFASTPVCNSGTFCGNVANGSPIGDSMPILLALGASLRLRSGASERELPLDQFYLGYQKKALAKGEFVSHVLLPSPKPGWRYASYKLSKRFDQDISAVCTGFAIHLEDGIVRNVRLGYGGMAATPSRAAQAEAALRGQPWNDASIAQAIAALAQDFKPLTDMRASSAYRLQAAGNLLRRFHLETTSAMPLRTRLAATDL